MYILFAKAIEPNHKFIELFTTIELCNQFLKNHPEFIKIEITEHEVNPK